MNQGFVQTIGKLDAATRKKIEHRTQKSITPRVAKHKTALSGGFVKKFCVTHY